MEHRWSSRKDIDSTITVHLQNFGAITARVKNVSRTGMLLDTRQFNLMQGSIVELAYTVIRKLQSETVRLKALTIHAGEGLAGLMFIEAAGDITALMESSAGHSLPPTHHTSDRRNGESGNSISSHSAGYASAGEGWHELRCSEAND